MDEVMGEDLFREVSERENFDTSVIWGKKTTKISDFRQRWEKQTKSQISQKRIRSILYTVVPSKLYISESVWPNWSSRVFYKDLPVLWRRCIRLAHTQNAPAIYTEEDQAFLKKITETAQKGAVEKLVADKETLLKEIQGLSDCYDNVFCSVVEQEINEILKRILYDPIYDIGEIETVFKNSFAGMIAIKNKHEKEFFQGRGKEKWWASGAVEDMFRMMNEDPKLFEQPK